MGTATSGIFAAPAPDIAALIRAKGYTAGGDRSQAPPRHCKNHFPVFTLVQSRLMTRWVAGSRAWMTNSFFCIASSG
jgi:hypothetical protein